jgi:hypothetical protein
VILRIEPQGRALIRMLKCRPMTYGDMQRTGISTSSQKRVMECLAEHEAIVKGERLVNGCKLVTWRVVASQTTPTTVRNIPTVRVRVPLQESPTPKSESSD